MTTTSHGSLTRETAKVVISPVQHFTGTRPTHAAARAYLVPKGRDLLPGDEGCAHDHGHKTIEAAKACGVKMWKRLP